MAKDDNQISKERFALWAINLGLATGHGDTAQDLLNEVGAQIKEIQEKLLECSNG